MAIFLRTCIAMLVLSVLSACAEHPPKVSLSDAIRGVGSDLGRFHAVSLLHVSEWNPATATAFSNSIKTEQCLQQTQDPILSIIDDKVSVQVEGQFTDTGAFSVGSVTTMPTLSFSGSSAKIEEQKIIVPVEYMPVSAMPDKLFFRQSADIAHLPTADTQKYLQVLSQNRDLLRTMVENATTTYDPTFCKQVVHTQRESSMMFGTKATYLPKN